MIWVVFALPFEGRGFAGCGGGFEKKILNVCGSAAARRVEELLYLASIQPGRVILAGLAGGLNPDLGIGDVLAHGEDVAGIRSGVVFTADAIVATREKKHALWRQTGADCVDLETAPVIEVCRRRGIPVVSLRAISDPASEHLPVPGHVLVDPLTMGPSIFAISRHLMIRPWKIPAFFRMAKNACLARERLWKTLESVLASASGQGRGAG